MYIVYTLSMKTVQIVKPIGEGDKIVMEAINITERFKVLPYYEVEKLLDLKTRSNLLSKAKA